jgi:hypothetical protein
MRREARVNLGCRIEQHGKRHLAARPCPCLAVHDTAVLVAHVQLERHILAATPEHRRKS